MTELFGVSGIGNVRTVARHLPPTLSWQRAAHGEPGSAWFLQSLLRPKAAYTWVGESAYSGCSIRQPTSLQTEPRSLLAALSLVKVVFGDFMCLSLVLISQSVQNVGGGKRGYCLLAPVDIQHLQYILDLKTWLILNGCFCKQQMVQLKVA